MKNCLYIQRCLFFCCIFFFSTYARANSFTITGIVVDSLQYNTIEFASVKLLSSKNRSMIQGEVTNNRGEFTLKNLKPASYILEVSYIGYNTAYLDISESQFNKNKIQLDHILLASSSITLDGVVVVAELPELVVKEDTLEYNATAFKMQESAVVEDLIKRLPGINVDAQGKITTATGKQVTRVFVDGKEFFGKDPKMATKNLTVNVVDKVQVVEKKSDLALLTGVEDDDPEIIINITIKKDMKRGWLGNITSGLGALIEDKSDSDPRYNENILLSHFDDKNQISLIANANNINRQGSTDESNTVRSGRGRFNEDNSIISSNSFGLNMANAFSKKIKFNGSVTYNYSDNLANSKSNLQNKDQNKPSYQRTEATDQDFSNNVSFDGKLEYKPDSLTTIVFTPSLSYNWSKSASYSNRNTRILPTDTLLLNEIQSVNSLKSDGLNLRAQFDISRKFSSKGRRASLSAWINTNVSEGNGISGSNEVFYNYPTKSKMLNQQSNIVGDRNTYNLRLMFVEPVGKGNFLNFSYNMQLNNTFNERQTYDYDSLTGNYILLNPNYSKTTDTRSINHTWRVNLNSSKKKYSYNVGLSVIPTHTRSQTYIKDWDGIGSDSITNPLYSRNVINLSPQLDFTYRMRNDKTMRRNFRIKYDGRTGQPSVSQLDPTPNVNNPLHIRSGNPDLLPSFRNTFSFIYNDYNRLSQRSFSATLNYVFTKNEFINYTQYNDSTTVRYTKPINANGSWHTVMNILYTKPLDGKKRFKFSNDLRAEYRNQIGFTALDSKSESKKNVARTTSFSETLGLSYSNSWFYGQLKSTGRFSDTRYSLETIEGQRYYHFDVSYHTQLDLPQNWNVSSEINYSGYRGLSEGYNRNELIWNVELNKYIFKTKKGILRFQLNDLLQQKLNIKRTITANYTSDTEYKVLTSYAMLSFLYQFNPMGNKTKK